MTGRSETRLSVDEVKALDIGCNVNFCGEDENGSLRVVKCTVAGLSGSKFLTYRDSGKIKKFAISDYPGKYYARVQ